MALTLGRTVKCLFFSLVVLLLLCISFIGDLNVVQFGVMGGSIGVLCSVIVLSNISISSLGNNVGNSMLFWRTICDLGVGSRLMLGPLFNIWQCNQLMCSTTNGHCSLPSGIMEFFMLSSECWFLCVALDLAISVSDPFASQKSRLRWYHLFCWTVAVVSGLIVGIDPGVNGTWYITLKANGENGGGVCWIQTHLEGGAVVIDPKPWVLYLLPLLLIYVVPLRSLLSSYRKVRMGLSKTFEHRGRMFLSSAINVVVYYVYLMLIFVLYMSSTWLAFPDPKAAGASFQMLVFALAARGYVNLMVYYVVDASEVVGAEQEKTIDVNSTLKEELLYFATIGITECARRSSSCTKTRDKFKLSLFENANEPSTSSHQETSEVSSQTPPFSIASFLTALIGADPSRMSQIIYRDPSLKSVTSVEVPEESSLPLSIAVSAGANPSRHSRSSSDASARDPELASAPAPSSFRAEAPSHLFKPTVSAMHLQKENSGDGIEIRVTEMSNRDSSGVDRSSRAQYSIDSGAAYVSYPILSSIYRTLFCLNEVPVEAPFNVEFTEYKPYYFRQIRISAGISDGEFIAAFQNTVKERLTEGGASGAFFFYSQGETFVAKSLGKQDMAYLLGSIEPYTTHLLNNKKSLITKIYGAYNLHIYGNDLNFVVMSNVLLTKGELINERYDIKGSWVKRNADVPRDGQLVTCRYCNKAYTFRRGDVTGRKNSSQSGSGSLGWNNASESVDQARSTDVKCRYAVFGMHKPNVTLKDNDLKSRILLSTVESCTILEQLKKDAEFLCQQGFMDYSLLIGVHNTEYQVEVPRGSYPTRDSVLVPTGGNSISNTPGKVRGSSTSTVTGAVTGAGPEEEEPLLSLVSPRYQAMRVVGPQAYYFGIIDFQQKWDYQKALERWAKMLYEPDRLGISAVEPGLYRDRFMRTLEELFGVDEGEGEGEGEVGLG